MSHHDFVVPSPDPGVPRWRADRARAGWARVHIEYVEAHPLPGDRGALVRAVVQLGGLTPADVRVALSPASGGVDAACEGGSAMWSSASYDNGAFVFEGAAPPREPGDDEWLVCVRPVEPDAGHPVLCRVRGAER